MEISPALQTWLNEQGFSSVDRNLDGFMCGETALHKAVKLHDDNIVQLLLKVRPKLAFDRDSKGRTALHCIARDEPITNTTISCVQQLIAHGSRLSSCDKYGQTPMHQILRYSPKGIESILKMFLSAGADPLVKDEQGNSPMQVALRSNGKGAAAGHQCLMDFIASQRKHLEIDLHKNPD